MKTLRLIRPDCEANSLRDAQKIVDAFASCGCSITRQDAIDAWRQYSSASRHRWIPISGLTSREIVARLGLFFDGWDPT